MGSLPSTDSCGWDSRYATLAFARLSISALNSGSILVPQNRIMMGPQLIEPRFNLDHEQAMSSLDRIVDLKADLLLPGHGEPWAGSPAEAVALIRG